METKERALKGPQDTSGMKDQSLLNGGSSTGDRKPRRGGTMFSWTTFSLGMNLAFLATMLAQRAPAWDWYSKALQQSEHLQMNDSSNSPCNHNLHNWDHSRLLCTPSPATPRLSSTASNHVQLCAGNGHYVMHTQTTGACHCHACFSGVHCGDLDPDCILNLFHGDPTLFEEYWLSQATEATVIPSWQGMSYFAHRHNSFLFVDYYLEQAIRSVHNLVGNAVSEGRFLVLGVGSTQLYQAALFALASSSSASPTSVVSTTPHYSSFEGVTKFLDSRRFKWIGDAEKFKREMKDDEPYIELVTSPNNPCGSMNTCVVNSNNGFVVNDLAYYWPHYVPITIPVDYPIMLWTLSKITGHAGTRLGWAIVQDASVAAKMAYFIQLNTLGVSQDAQQRGLTLLRTIMSSYQSQAGPPQPPGRDSGEPVHKLQPFFHYGQAVLEDRWRRMRLSLANSSRFVLPEYDSLFCSFLGKPFSANPAFLWLRCRAEEDCGQLLKDNKIIARSGPAFGVSNQYVRVSMLDRHRLFNLLLARLAALK